MWVKRNTMGAGTTDAFLFNYGVGIGSTQVPNGVRLAVGSVQITDNQVNTTNLNATGVGTINTANITNLSISGVVTSGGYNIGIQSGGLSVTTGVITSLNFIGAGNTFSYNAGTKTVDINIGGSQWTFTDQANPTTSSIYRVNGNVGVGTTNPTSKLNVWGTVSIGATNSIDLGSVETLFKVVNDNQIYAGAGSILNEGYGSGIAQPGYIARFARGTAAAPSQVLANDRLAYLVGGGFGTSTFVHSTSLDFFAQEDYTQSARGSYIRFTTTNIGEITRSEKVRITASGNVGIATTTPAEKLTVVGNTLLSGDVGINTNSITNPNLTGVGNSFNGVYIANGMIIVDNTLEGDHYIGTAYNGLMAGPVTINGILTVDGNYVVV